MHLWPCPKPQPSIGSRWVNLLCPQLSRYPAIEGALSRLEAGLWHPLKVSTVACQPPAVYEPMCSLSRVCPVSLLAAYLMQACVNATNAHESRTAYMTATD